VLGTNVSVRQRDYRKDIVIATGDKRRDRIVSPGAFATITNLFGYRKDLRLEYKYIWNDSNDPSKFFEDHVFTVSAVSLFDPTRGPDPQGSRKARPR
jgi:hypothetical protein